MLIDTRKSSHAKVCGLSHTDVRWDAGFWKDLF